MLIKRKRKPTYSTFLELDITQFLLWKPIRTLWRLSVSISFGKSIILSITKRIKSSV